MASSSSNAMFGDVYVDDLISSYSGVQDFTKHAGVSFKDRTNKGFMKAGVSLRRPQQLLYGPLNFGRSTFDASWRIQNAGLLHGLWSKNLSTSSACCLAGTAHDLSYESSPPDELEDSSTLPNLLIIMHYKPDLSLTVFEQGFELQLRLCCDACIKLSTNTATIAVAMQLQTPKPLSAAAIASHNLKP
ncbi:putative protein phosphatase 2C 55-like protein [Trifolium pratense]|uniref:Uncharacterized protein n=1 Tax=Trifolium pratense TaxID=57577 RepID=A0A2K3PE44_TRIPR|nr:putative protein phosphatase 2C 55-like protein [Trifolium pratense]PNY15495.1 putative protein phosphatase 2C 55-like protein [Trifolium pratense]